MEKVPTEAKLYIDALRPLVKTGIHAAASLEQSPLIELQVVKREAGLDANAAARADAFIQTLERVIDQKFDGKLREIARRVFAIGEWAGVAQRERCDKAAKLHDPHWKWENYRKGPLTKLLFSVYTALRREGERHDADPVVGHEADDQPDRDKAVGGNYVISRLEFIYNLPPKPGAPREILELREVKALGDNVEAWRQSTRHWDATDAMPEVSFFGSGVFSIIQKGRLRDLEPSRAYIQEVRFAQPLHKGETARFTLMKCEVVPFENLIREPGYQDFLGLGSITAPIGSATVSVRFPEGHRPSKVWHYEDIPGSFVPGEASPSNTVEVDKSGFATDSWAGLEVGCSYGLAWEW